MAAGRKKPTVSSWSPTTTMTIPFDVYIREDVLTKLAEYARAAAPDEIGGLAKVEKYGDRDVIVTDLAMLEQQATGATFNIDSEQVNRFVVDLVQQDRADEVQHWCSIVHSHPNGMTPAMSGVDIDNITKLADEDFFFSLIIVADPDADAKRIAMHYAQRTPFGDLMILNELPVHVAPSAERQALREQIEDEVKKIIKPRLPVRYSQGGHVGHRGFSFSPGDYLGMGDGSTMYLGDIDEPDDVPTLRKGISGWDWYDCTDDEIVVLPELADMDSYEQAAFMQELDRRDLVKRYVERYIREGEEDGYGHTARDRVETALHWAQHGNSVSSSYDLKQLLDRDSKKQPSKKRKRKSKKRTHRKKNNHTSKETTV